MTETDAIQTRGPENRHCDNGRSKIGAEHWYQISDSDSWSDEEMQSLYTLFMADTAVFLADTSSLNLGRMINHKAIVDRFQKYTPGLEAAESHGLDYDILEGAAVLGKGGPPPTFSSGFGYALWAVDFNLVCMSRGVKRVANLAGRPSASRVFWVPDDSSPSNPGPNARAPYPAAIMIADFIGKGHGSSVKEIDLGRDLLSAYAMYNEGSGDLERVALLNMRLYNGTQDKPRDRSDLRFLYEMEYSRLRYEGSVPTWVLLPWGLITVALKTMLPGEESSGLMGLTLEMAISQPAMSLRIPSRSKMVSPR